MINKEKVVMKELKENGYGCVESKGEKGRRLNVTVHPIHPIHTTKYIYTFQLCYYLIIPSFLALPPNLSSHTHTHIHIFVSKHFLLFYVYIYTSKNILTHLREPPRQLEVIRFSCYLIYL